MYYELSFDAAFILRFKSHKVVWWLAKENSYSNFVWKKKRTFLLLFWLELRLGCIWFCWLIFRAFSCVPGCFSASKNTPIRGLFLIWLDLHLRPLNQLRYMHSSSNSHHIITLLEIHWQLIIIRWHLGTQTYTSKDDALKQIRKNKSLGSIETRNLKES